MAGRTPTKGNLMSAKNSLKMAAMGYDLLDRKRKLLLRELSQLTEKENALKSEISDTFSSAYVALREANITMGIDRVGALAASIPEVHDIDIKFYSVMGVEIPMVRATGEVRIRPSMSLYQTNLSLDEARHHFIRVRDLTLKLAEVRSGVKRLQQNVMKTQTRANALKNIMIPRYTGLIAEISAALEEKEREEFARLKVIKRIISR